MFRRPHHNAIHGILAALETDVLVRSQTWFGGGTAIVLKLGEYRESRDIDFLCASQSGYRLLREATFGGSIDQLLKPTAEVVAVRDARADQYGIRTQIEAQGTTIRFEIRREARIELSGEFDSVLGVPVLSRSDMYCEKLLANAGRYADRSVLNRDVIDLSMMVLHWGPIPEAAWEKARKAYGRTVDTAYEKAVAP